MAGEGGAEVPGSLPSMGVTALGQKQRQTELSLTVDSSMEEGKGRGCWARLGTPWLSSVMNVSPILSCPARWLGCCKVLVPPSMSTRCE